MHNIIKYKTIVIICALLVHTSFFFAHATIAQAQSYACAMQTDGKVVAAGMFFESNVTEFCIARYQTNGSLDTAYALDGYTITQIGSEAQALGLALQPFDGKAVAVGYAVENNITKVALARYTTAGALDTTFNTTGIQTLAVGNGAIATSVAIDANNKIVIGGVAIESGVAQFLMVRFNTDGSLDTTFGSGGIVTRQIGARAKALSMAIQPTDNKIVLAGYSSDGMTGERFALARFNTDGTLDINFGTSGITNTPIGSMSHATSIVIQSDGALVVGGFSDSQYVIARYLSNGTLDTSFNGTGIVNRALGLKAQINAVALDANSKIIATGFTDTRLLIARYTITGSLDTTFNATGENTLLFEITNAGCSLAQQADDKIIVMGNTDDDFLLTRYTTAGLLDTTWGINGITTEPNGTLDNFVIRIWDEKLVGTNGGTFTAGSWQARTLNKIFTVSHSVSLAANRFIIEPGLYEIQIIAPAYRVGNHQIRLQNITDNVTTLSGSTSFSNASIGSMTTSLISGQLSINKQTTFEVQHMCSLTEANDGFGIAAGFGAAEIYTTVNIVPN